MKISTACRFSQARLALAACVVVLTPVAALAQSGILHKRTYAPPTASLAATASPLRAMAGSVSSLPAPADPGAMPPGGPMGPGQGWGDAVSGIAVGVPVVADGAPSMVAGCVPGFPGHDAPGFDGGAVVTLPGGIDGVGGEVQIMPYPFSPGGSPPVAPMPGEIVVMPGDIDGFPGVAHGRGPGAGPGFRTHGGEGFKRGAAVSLPAAVDVGDGVQVMSLAAAPAGGRLESAPAGSMTRAAQPGGRLLAQPPASGLHKHAMGVRGSVNAAPAAEAAAAPESAVARSRAVPSVQPVGVVRSAAPLRWADRLRFSWPGSSN
jgi:hypothetical protein